MKKYIILGLIILIAACEKDHDPVSPGSTDAVIQIIIKNNTASKSSSATSSVLDKAAKSAVVNQCEVRVLKSDNFLHASKTPILIRVLIKYQSNLLMSPLSGGLFISEKHSRTSGRKNHTLLFSAIC